MFNIKYTSDRLRFLPVVAIRHPRSAANDAVDRVVADDVLKRHVPPHPRHDQVQVVALLPLLHGALEVAKTICILRNSGAFVEK